MITKRVISPGAEEWLGVTQKILNDGEIELVDYMGTEEQMVGIARISHGSILPHVEQKDATRLINYLMKNRHTSPFEFIETTWRMRLPIFVARQIVRHRTASINEKSARYAELDATMYIPDDQRVKGQDKNNKQGSAGELDYTIQSGFTETLKEWEEESRQFYQTALGAGIAKETARIHLPVGIYTDWVWKIDLHNLLHFLELRLHPHAQYEVQVYAQCIWGVISQAYPTIAAAFDEYVLGAVTFSKTEWEEFNEQMG